VQKELLQKKMQKNFFRMIIIPFVTLTLIFALFFGFFRFYMGHERKTAAIRDAKHILCLILDSQKVKLEHEFEKINTYAKILQQEHEHLFKYQHCDEKEFHFLKAKNGVFYANTPSGSSVCYPPYITIDKNKKIRALITQEMDKTFKTIIKNNYMIKHIYFIGFDGMIKIYPHKEKIYNLYDPLKQSRYQQNYTLANQINNQSRSILWSDPFFDSKTQSWMISVLIPIYNNNKLEGVTGLDIALKPVMQQLLTTKLPYNTEVLLINEQGTITALSPSLQKVLNIETDKLNIFKTNNKFLQKIVSSLKNEHATTFDFNHTQYITLHATIKDINSNIILVAKRENILATLHDILVTSIEMIVFMAVLFGIILIVFYFVAKKQFRRISSEIVDPILSLAKISANVEKYKGNIPYFRTQIAEIDTLSDNFKMMINNIYEKDLQLKSFNTQLIQEVQKATKDLQEKNKTINIIFDTLMEGVVLWNTQYKLIKANKVAVDIFKYEDEKDMIGKELFDFVPASEKENAQQALQQTKILPYEIQLFKKDGSTFPALVQGQDLYIGEVKHRLTTVLDITEIKEKEKQLLQQSKQAQMGEMINMIAHQWRQPLNAISAAAIRLSMLSSMQALTDEKTQEASKSIQEQCQKMSKTIDTFLNFARPSQKKELFNLQDTFNAVMDLMLTQLKNHNIEIEINLEDNLQLYGFADQLEQVIINILANARDAFDEIEQEEKKITITALQKDNEINICIEDNAGGIAPNVVDKIFNPYFTTKEQGKGTGIGLYMSLEIMRKSFNGDLIYKPRENGSCFFLICKEEKIDAATK